MYSHINKSGCLSTSALKDSILEHEKSCRRNSMAGFMQILIKVPKYSFHPYFAEKTNSNGSFALIKRSHYSNA